MQKEGKREECWNVRRHNFKKQAFCHSQKMTLPLPISFSTLCQKVIPQKAERAATDTRAGGWKIVFKKVRPCYYSWVTQNHNLPTILGLTKGLWITSLSITGTLVIARQVPDNHRLPDDGKVGILPPMLLSSQYFDHNFIFKFWFVNQWIKLALCGFMDALTKSRRSSAHFYPQCIF